MLFGFFPARAFQASCTLQLMADLVDQNRFVDEVQHMLDDIFDCDGLNWDLLSSCTSINCSDCRLTADQRISVAFPLQHFRQVSV